MSSFNIGSLEGWGGWVTGFAIFILGWRHLPAVVGAFTKLIEVFSERNKGLYAAFDKQIDALQADAAALRTRLDEMQETYNQERHRCDQERREWDQDRNRWQEERESWHKERMAMLHEIEGLNRKILAQADALGRLLGDHMDAPEATAAMKRNQRE